MRNGESIMQNAVLLRLSFSRAGGVRRGDLQAVQTDCDKRRLKLGKVLFVSQEYKAIQTYDNALMSWVAARAIGADVGLHGVSILPRGLLADVEARLTEAQAEREKLVSEFLAVYPAEVDGARARMADQFRASDYPDAEVIKAAYAIRWAYIQFGPADGLPTEVAERERAKMKERFSQAETDVCEALRVSFRDLVAHLAERLQPGDDGKKRIFRDSAVENLVEFLGLFSKRNITDDSELAALADKARGIVDGVSPDALRELRSVRETVRAGLADVGAAVDKLIVSQPRRKFDLGD